MIRDLLHARGCSSLSSSLSFSRALLLCGVLRHTIIHSQCAKYPHTAHKHQHTLVRYAYKLSTHKHETVSHTSITIDDDDDDDEHDSRRSHSVKLPEASLSCDDGDGETDDDYNDDAMTVEKTHGLADGTGR